MKRIVLSALLVAIAISNLFSQEQTKRINIKSNEDFFNNSKYIVEGKILRGGKNISNYDNGLQDIEKVYTENLFVVRYIYKDVNGKIKANDTITIVRNVGGLRFEYYAEGGILTSYEQYKYYDYSDGKENILPNKSKYYLDLFGSTDTFIFFLNDSDYPENPNRKNNYLKTRFLENSIPSGFQITRPIRGLIGLNFKDRYELYKYMRQFEKIDVTIPLSDKILMWHSLDTESYRKYLKEIHNEDRHSQEVNDSILRFMKKQREELKKKLSQTNDKANNNITLSIINQEQTYNNGTHYYEFDIAVSSNVNTNYLFYLEPWISYNTTAFGSNIVANDKVVVTNIINTKYNEIHSDGYNNNELAISYLYNNSGGMQQLTSTPMTILSIKIALLQGLNNIPANTLFLTNMNAMYCTSATGTTYYNYDATFYNNPTFILNTMLPSITTNLSQITKHAGVGEILTINGNNFGNTRGEFYFTSPRNGGIENGQTDFTTKINDYDILSWTNTQISVKVPSRIYDAVTPYNQSAVQGAGSGPIKIVKANGKDTISSTSLNIDYSIMNVGGSETTAPKRMHLARTACNADYVFLFIQAFETIVTKHKLLHQYRLP